MVRRDQSLCESRASGTSVVVIGFDNTSESLQSSPALTTMMVDRPLMGAMAVRMLYEQSIRQHTIPMTLRVGTQLVKRDSVCRRHTEMQKLL